MPCCALIALLLSQPLMLAGAVKARLFGKLPRSAPNAGGWKAVALTGFLGAELVAGSAAIPLLLSGQANASIRQSAIAFWHVCTVSPEK